MPLPAPQSWDALTPATDEFRRVNLRAQFVEDAKPALRLYRRLRLARRHQVSPAISCSRRRGCRTDASWWSTAAMCRSRPHRTPVARDRPRSSAICAFRNRRSWFVVRSRCVGRQSGSSRDHRAMAEERGWGEIAPFYIDQEARCRRAACRSPARSRCSLRNDHLGYALTWFGLAAGLAAVFAVWAAAQRRKKA